jgi:hypothetical protein
VSAGIHIEAHAGEVHVIVHALRKKLLVRVRPAYARTLSMRLQEAAERAETMQEPARAEDSPWEALGRWVRKFGGER